MTEYKIMLKKTLPSKHYPKNYKDYNAMILLKATVSAYLERKIEKKRILSRFPPSSRRGFCLTGF